MTGAAATRILLVEDNPGDAVIFRETLDGSELAYDLVHAERLADGLDRLGDAAFDILMVDLSLPDAHGMETVRQVRETAPDVPLIVLTGLDDAASAAEAKRLGAVDYLVKWYVDSASLARYIRYAIAQYEQYRADGERDGSDEAPAPPSRVVEGRVVRPPDPSPPESSSDADAPGVDASGVDASEMEVPPGTLPEPVEAAASLLRHAAECALAFAERAERRSAWMADVMRSALDLHRVATGEVEVQPGRVDVLDLARQVVTEQRGLAMRCGIPLYVSADHKKVFAHADRNLVTGILRRLVVDAVQSADGSGVEIKADTDGTYALILAVWTESRASLGASADCVALGRSVVEQTAHLAGGDASRDGDASGRYVLTLRLPGPA